MAQCPRLQCASVSAGQNSSTAVLFTRCTPANSTRLYITKARKRPRRSRRTSCRKLISWSSCSSSCLRDKPSLELLGELLENAQLVRDDALLIALESRLVAEDLLLVPCGREFGHHSPLGLHSTVDQPCAPLRVRAGLARVSRDRRRPQAGATGRPGRRRHQRRARGSAPGPATRGPARSRRRLCCCRPPTRSRGRAGGSENSPSYTGAGTR